MKRISLNKLYCTRKGNVIIPIQKNADGTYLCIAYQNHEIFLRQKKVKRTFITLKRNEIKKLSNLVAFNVAEAVLPSSPAKAFQYI